MFLRVAVASPTERVFLTSHNERMASVTATQMLNKPLNSPLIQPCRTVSSLRVNLSGL